MRYLIVFLLCCTFQLNAQKEEIAIADDFIINIVGDEIFQKCFVYDDLRTRDSIQIVSYDLVEDGDNIAYVRVGVLNGKAYDIRQDESTTLLLEWYKQYFENENEPYVRYKEIKEKAIYHIGEGVEVRLRDVKKGFDKCEKEMLSLMEDGYVWECENSKTEDFIEDFYIILFTDYTHSLYINPYNVNLYAIKTDGYSSMYPTPFGELESMSQHVTEWEDSIINYTDTICTHMFTFTDVFGITEAYEIYLGFYINGYGLLKELPKQDTIITNRYSTIDYKINKKEVLVGIVTDSRDIEIKLYYNNKSQVVALIREELKEVSE